MTRDVIQREDVTSELLADGRVGYLKVSGFSSGSAQDLHDLLAELVQTDHVQALILDLRDDPGGYVDAAQKIASEFTTADPLYWEQTATGAPEPQHPTPGGAATDPSHCRWSCWSTAGRPARARSSRPRCRAITARC